MIRLSLAQALAMIEAATAEGARLGLRPLTMVVTDPSGSLIAMNRQDGGSKLAPKIATGKAAGALAMNVSSRRLGEMALERPHFIAAVTGMNDGGITPVAGGLIVRDSAGTVLGAMAVSGDTSDNDEACVLAAVAAVGLEAVL